MPSKQHYRKPTNTALAWRTNPKRPPKAFIPIRQKQSLSSLTMPWKASWPVLAAKKLRIQKLPLDCLENRPSRFSGLSGLAWNILWLGSWGYGINQMLSIYKGSRPSGWIKTVKEEIDLLLSSARS